VVAESVPDEWTLATGWFFATNAITHDLRAFQAMAAPLHEKAAINSASSEPTVKTEAESSKTGRKRGKMSFCFVGHSTLIRDVCLCAAQAEATTRAT
jgi:hypothetical protein